MINDKISSENKNTRENLILEYIKEIHPDHLKPDFRMTVEFIKLVFFIDDKIRNCPAKFFKNEFAGDQEIKKLCTLIMNDGYDVSIKARKETIKWLNELLKIPNLFERVQEKRKRFRASQFLMMFYPPGGKKEYSEFSRSQQQDIVKFNRMLLEELYPDDTPKHICSKTNLKYQSKGGMISLVVDDIFNNLPKEVVCRPLDHKTIETIFDVFEARSFTWCVQELAGLDVSGASGYRNRGSSKYALEQYEEAITDYNHSIELDPESSSTFICRARAFMKIGQVNEALNDAVHAYEMIRINHCPENYIRLATVFEECRRYDFVMYCINQYLRHTEKLEYYYDHAGDLWVVKNGYKSTGFCTSGNVIQIDWLDDAKEILDRIREKLEWDDKQQKLFPLSTIDDLRTDLSITRDKVDESVKRLQSKNHI